MDTAAWFLPAAVWFPCTLGMYRCRLRAGTSRYQMAPGHEEKARLLGPEGEDERQVLRCRCGYL